MDLDTLTNVVARGAPKEIAARVRVFFAKHEVSRHLGELVERTAGEHRIGTYFYGPTKDSQGYRVYGSTDSPFFIGKYNKNLEKLLPRVERGKMTLQEARKKAAFWDWLLSPFVNQHAMEIANLDELKGVRVCRGVGISWSRLTYHDRIDLFPLSELRPNYWTEFRHSWRDLEGRCGVDEKTGHCLVDKDSPSKGYDTLLRTLRYLDEILDETPRK